MLIVTRLSNLPGSTSGGETVTVAEFEQGCKNLLCPRALRLICLGQVKRNAAIGCDILVQHLQDIRGIRLLEEENRCNKKRR